MRPGVHKGILSVGSGTGGSHHYAKSGVYTVTVSVKEVEGATASRSTFVARTAGLRDRLRDLIDRRGDLALAAVLTAAGVNAGMLRRHPLEVRAHRHARPVAASTPVVAAFWLRQPAGITTRLRRRLQAVG